MTREQILKFRYSCERCDSVKEVEFPSGELADEHMIDDFGWQPIAGYGHGATWMCARHGYMEGRS